MSARRASAIHLLPKMKRRAPQQVPIIACYATRAFANPTVTEANPEVVRDAGINWLWGSNKSRLARLLKPDGMKFARRMPRNGFSQSPIDTRYLERHPDHRAVTSARPLHPAVSRARSAPKGRAQ